jgi:hypothetical protein
MDVGARLREAREARGLSIASLSGITRLAPRWLETIERNDPSPFPPGPYARGYVRAYAREVGLDPDDTAREYFAQFPQAPPPLASPEPRSPVPTVSFDRPGRRPIGLPLVVALGVALAVLGWNGTHQDNPVSEPAGAVGTSGRTAGPESAPASAQPVATSATAAAAPLRVTLAADGPAWITAAADGKRVMYQLVGPGTRQTIDATREVAIRVGDAGAVRWTIGARDAGPMGAPGEVRTVVVTPENAATIR